MKANVCQCDHWDRTGDAYGSENPITVTLNATTNQPMTTGTHCPGKSFNLLAVPAAGWTFLRWCDFDDITDPSQTFTLGQGPENFVAEFVHRPGAAELDLVSDLAYTLQTVGITESVDTYDNNKLVGITEVPETEVEVMNYGPNGIPEAAELKLIEATLKDFHLDHSGERGVTNDGAWKRWQFNLNRAQTDLPANTDPRIVRTVAAYMTLGDYGSRCTISDMIKIAIPAATINGENYQTAYFRFFGAEKDADNNGVRNCEAWNAAVAAAEQNNETPAQTRAAYTNAALVGMQYDNGQAKSMNSGASGESAPKTTRQRSLLDAQQVRENLKQPDLQSSLQQLQKVLAEWDHHLSRITHVTHANTRIGSRTALPLSQDLASIVTKEYASECPNGTCCATGQASVGLSWGMLEEYPPTCSVSDVVSGSPLNESVLLGTKVSVQTDPAAVPGFGFVGWSAPGTMANGSVEKAETFRLMGNVVAQPGFISNIAKVQPGSPGSVTINVTPGKGACQVLDSNGDPVLDEDGYLVYHGPGTSYLDVSATVANANFEIGGWMTSGPSYCSSKRVRVPVGCLLAPVIVGKVPPSQKSKLVTVSIAGGKGYVNNSYGWPGQFRGKVEVGANSHAYIGVISNPGYRFVGWSDGNTSEFRGIIVGDNSVTYTPLFEEVDDQYTLEIGDNVEASSGTNGGGGESGSPLCMGYVTVENPDYPDSENPPNRKKYYAQGEQIAVVAHPTPGYKFVHWEGDGTNVSGTPLKDVTSEAVVIQMGPANGNCVETSGSRSIQAVFEYSAKLIVAVRQPVPGTPTVATGVYVGHSWWQFEGSTCGISNELIRYLNQPLGYGPDGADKGEGIFGLSDRRSTFYCPDDLLNTAEVVRQFPIRSFTSLVAGLQYAKDLENSVGTVPYNVETHNCTDAVIGAAASVGVTLPDTQGSHTIYVPQSIIPPTWITITVGPMSNPGCLGEDIRNLGSPYP